MCDLLSECREQSLWLGLALTHLFVVWLDHFSALVLSHRSLRVEDGIERVDFGPISGCLTKDCVRFLVKVDDRANQFLALVIRTDLYICGVIPVDADHTIVRSQVNSHDNGTLNIGLLNHRYFSNYYSQITNQSNR